MQKVANRVFILLSGALMAILLTVVPRSVASSQIADTPFGINSFVTNRYEWNEWGVPAGFIRELGVSWLREEFVWKMIEPERGNWNWGFYDRSLEETTKTNTNILGILDYSAPWATEEPGREGADKYAPDHDLWRNYVRAVVTRYGPKVEAWQVWNEPNISVFFKPEPNVAEYMTLLKIASEEIRVIDPTAEIVMAGTSKVDTAYIEAMFDQGAGDLIDIMAVHPYPGDFRTHPELNGLEANYATIQRLAERYDKPVWITELGWPTNIGGGVTEYEQAKRLVIAYLVSAPYDRLDKFFWYNLRDDGTNASYHEHRFGMMGRDYTKKDSFYAYQNLISRLDGARFVKNNSDNRGYYDLEFRRGKTATRVLWSVSTKSNSQLQITTPNAVRMWDMLGKNIVLETKNDSILPVADTPLFVQYDLDSTAPTIVHTPKK